VTDKTKAITITLQDVRAHLSRRLERLETDASVGGVNAAQNRAQLEAEQAHVSWFLSTLDQVKFAKMIEGTDPDDL